MAIGSSATAQVRRLRLFAGEIDDPRSRRATDVLLVLGAALTVTLLGAAARPQPGIERRLMQFVASIPNGFDGLWRAFVGAVYALSILAVAAALVGRRWAVLRDAVCAALLVAALASALTRLVLGDWPALPAALVYTGGHPDYPPLGVTVAVVITVTMSPHLNRPLRRLGRWLIAAATVGIVVLGSATPIGAGIALLLAVAAAAAVHLAFGSAEGRPRIDDVVLGLRSLGVEVGTIGVAQRQSAGVFVLDATGVGGESLTVKVYGRDAHDTQLLTTAWRTIWYRESGSPSWFGRREQAEHEAFITLLAEQAGAVASRVVTAGVTSSGDVAVVLHDDGRPIRDEDWDPAVATRSWAALKALHDANIAHGRVESQNLRCTGDRVALVDLRGAAVAPKVDHIHADDAQLLATTCLTIGVEPAVNAATDALGTDRLVAALPFVQSATLTPDQRKAIRGAGLGLDAIRSATAERLGVKAPQLQQLRRVTARSLLQMALLITAFFAIAAAFGALDLSGLADQLEHATWWLVLAGVMVAQLNRLTAACSMLGAAPVDLPLGPVYALQLANSYISLAVPTSAARFAVDIRFLQRHGLQASAAFAVGLIDQLTEFFVQLIIIAGLLLLTPAALHLDLGESTPGDLNRLIVVVGVLALLAILLVAAIPRWRNFLVGWIVRLARDAGDNVRGLRSPRRLATLVSANLGTEAILAIALATTVRGFHYEVGLAEVLLITVSVRVVSGLVPIPGGVGVAESALVFGLVRAGLPEDVAFACALIYRLATFYVPPLWGFFALRWLERNEYL